MQEVSTNPENQPRVPVISSDGYPLIPCRPKRARILLEQGQAIKTWVRGNFAIRMTNRDRAESTVPEMTLGITPGSKTTGFAVTQDQDETQERRVIHVMELELIGHQISMKLRGRATHRRTRRSRLRHRKPRFDNRRKPKGSLPPSIRHNLDRMLDWAQTLYRLYPVAQIRISTAKFDPQLIENPNIQGEEYQKGTLQGWQLRAYVFHQNRHRCFYCGEQTKKLTLDHIIPTSRGGTNRVSNLTAACIKCNQQKDNQIPEEFLADNPEKLLQLLATNPRSTQRDTGWMNTLMPFLLEGLTNFGIPLEQTNGAQTSWNRQQLQLPKNHLQDAAILGSCQSLSGMPGLIAQVTPDNGRRKQKAQVDKDGTPRGKPFRDYCRLSPRERSRRPTPGHAGKRTHFGPELLATGDIMTIQNKKLGAVTGRGVMVNRGRGVKVRVGNGTPSGPTATARLVRRNPGYTKTMVETG